MSLSQIFRYLIYYHNVSPIYIIISCDKCAWLVTFILQRSYDCQGRHNNWMKNHKEGYIKLFINKLKVPFSGWITGLEKVLHGWLLTPKMVAFGSVFNLILLVGCISHRTVVYVTVFSIFCSFWCAKSSCFVIKFCFSCRFQQLQSSHTYWSGTKGFITVDFRQKVCNCRDFNSLHYGEKICRLEGVFVEELAFWFINPGKILHK